MNWRWEVVLEAIPVVLEGARLTLLISVLGILFGTVIGIFLGLQRSQRPTNVASKLLYAVSGFYIEVIRGTPFLVQLYLVNYGAPLFFGINVPELTAGIAAISLNSGAYMAEIIRAGIQSVERGQMEAGRSLGLTYWQSMRHIIMPQAVKRALPPMGNEFITLIKESSVVSVLGVAETSFKGKIVGSSNYAPFEPMVVVTVVYLVMTWVTGRLIALMERRLKQGDLH